MLQVMDIERDHQGIAPGDARGVARINPSSDVGSNSDPLDVGNDIGSCEEHVKAANLVSGVGCASNLLDVCTDIISRIEQVKVANHVSDVATHWMSVWTSALV